MKCQPLLQPILWLLERILIHAHINAILQEAIERNPFIDKELLFWIQVEELAIEALDNTVAIDDQEPTRHVFDRRCVGKPRV